VPQQLGRAPYLDVPAWQHGDRGGASLDSLGEAVSMLRVIGACE
jgi:hypothetical protein